MIYLIEYLIQNLTGNSSVLDNPLSYELMSAHNLELIGSYWGFEQVLGVFEVCYMTHPVASHQLATFSLIAKYHEILQPLAYTYWWYTIYNATLVESTVSWGILRFQISLACKAQLKFASTGAGSNQSLGYVQSAGYHVILQPATGYQRITYWKFRCAYHSYIIYKGQKLTLRNSTFLDYLLAGRLRTTASVQVI